MYRSFFKRAFDLVASGIALILLSPIFLLISVLIKIDSRGPILFKQKRVGKGKKLFKIYKFRTMRIDTPSETPTHMLENPQKYITKVGRFLRKSSLDELPQIINIFLGKMSIVGPRPALWNQDDLVAERDKYGANDVLPGLTGLAQIKGRDALEITVKAKFDGDYVNHITFFNDIRIIFLTALSVFRSEGIVEGGTGELKKSKNDIEQPIEVKP